jgi:hypothetical protein
MTADYLPEMPRAFPCAWHEIDPVCAIHLRPLAGFATVITEPPRKNYSAAGSTGG